MIDSPGRVYRHATVPGGVMQMILLEHDGIYVEMYIKGKLKIVDIKNYFKA